MKRTALETNEMKAVQAGLAAGWIEVAAVWMGGGEAGLEDKSLGAES